jgi:hypothetical protein
MLMIKPGAKVQIKQSPDARPGGVSPAAQPQEGKE